VSAKSTQRRPQTEIHNLKFHVSTQSSLIFRGINSITWNLNHRFGELWDISFAESIFEGKTERPKPWKHVSLQRTLARRFRHLDFLWLLQITAMFSKSERIRFFEHVNRKVKENIYQISWRKISQFYNHGTHVTNIAGPRLITKISFALILEAFKNSRNIHGWYDLWVRK
jgi:hypothetical protein